MGGCPAGRKSRRRLLREGGRRGRAARQKRGGGEGVAKIEKREEEIFSAVAGEDRIVRDLSGVAAEVAAVAWPLVRCAQALSDRKLRVNPAVSGSGQVGEREQDHTARVQAKRQPCLTRAAFSQSAY